ncbi:MAG: CinA family protein [Pseudomonadales bacterium]|nr:CinA family protein [Pseudomonadales bacterium]
MLAIAGGGSSAIAKLLDVPGASNTLLESIVPYSTESLTDYLGTEPQQACSASTARNMAMIAFQRANALSTKSQNFGLGCTAALTTNRQRRGLDRCFIALQSCASSIEITLILDKQSDRAAQEAQCSNFILQIMALGSGIIPAITDSQITLKIQSAEAGWQALLQQQADSTWEQEKAPQVLFPGAFNPTHDGHRKMYQLAGQITGKPVVMEISTTNVDKPMINYLDMAERQADLNPMPLLFTRAPTFIEKSRLFPGTIFVVGIDTIRRIADPKYYANSLPQRDAAIEKLVANNHRFLVFGRLDKDQYLTLSDIPLPAQLANICDAVTEKEFRSDLSSSAIRQQTGI